MKRLIALLAVAGCLALALAVVQSQAAKPQPKFEGYHQLLLLDQREAIQHAKVLDVYVRHHAQDLDPEVLAKHIDELGRNLTGMQNELERIEGIDLVEKKALDPQAAEIRDHQLKARLEFEALKLEAKAEKPNPEKIQMKAIVIYNELRQADAHHHKVMEAAGVREPE